MLIPLLLILLNTSYSSTRIYDGIARDEGEIVYYQKYSVVGEKKAQRVFIEMWDPNGRRLGYKKIIFREHSYLPDVYFKEFLSKEVNDVTWGFGKVKVIQTNRVQKVESNLNFSPQQNRVFDFGIHNFILDHWDQVLKGEDLHVSAFFHQFGEWRDLVIKRAWKTKKEIGVFFTRNKVDLYMFQPSNYLTYRIKDKSLIGYRGVSLVKDTKGRYLNVDIEYQEQK